MPNIQKITKDKKAKKVKQETAIIPNESLQQVGLSIMKLHNKKVPQHEIHNTIHEKDTIKRINNYKQKKMKVINTKKPTVIPKKVIRGAYNPTLEKTIVVGNTHIKPEFKN